VPYLENSQICKVWGPLTQVRGGNSKIPIDHDFFVLPLNNMQYADFFPFSSPCQDRDAKLMTLPKNLKFFIFMFGSLHLMKFRIEFGVLKL